MSRTIQIHPLSVAVGALAVLAAGMLSGWSRGPSPLDFMSVVQIDDGFGNRIDTVRFTGCNVQIVNGLDETATLNGAGNLIVGYNEFGNPRGDDRTGSHNIVGGTSSSYESFGGLVIGRENTISGMYASVTGGEENLASGHRASVCGGAVNEAEGFASVVVGGSWNRARNDMSSIGGGAGNETPGVNASVSGGTGNVAFGDLSSVSGGYSNAALGDYSSVSGGQHNEAKDWWSSVSGGSHNTADAQSASVSGGEFNLACGFGASVSGGQGNVASGGKSSVSGGKDNVAAGTRSAVGGGVSNHAAGVWSSVAGGQLNVADGAFASVGGQRRLRLAPPRLGELQGRRRRRQGRRRLVEPRLGGDATLLQRLRPHVVAMGQVAIALGPRLHGRPHRQLRLRLRHRLDELGVVDLGHHLPALDPVSEIDRDRLDQPLHLRRDREPGPGLQRSAERPHVVSVLAGRPGPGPRDTYDLPCQLGPMGEQILRANAALPTGPESEP